MNSQEENIQKGLHLYLSNSLDNLLKKFLYNFEQSYKNTGFFNKKTVVIQTAGIAKWLSFKIADSMGVCSNVDFVFPKGFIVDILQKNGFLESKDVDYYDKANIIVNILKRLEKENIAELENYVADKDSKKFGQFVSYLADLFDQYFTYRPEFVLNSKKISVEWQRRLFEGVVNNKFLTLPEVINRFVKKNSKLKMSEDTGVELFAISLLPPVYISFFKKLSNYKRVNLYILNPSRDFWFDEPGRMKILRIKEQEESPTCLLHFSESNPVLINNGKLTQDFFWFLYSDETTPWCEIEDYETFENNTGLNKLKNKILNNEHESFILQDKTIQIHSHHTKLREIEGLYNYILNILEENNDIALEDIIVMCPDIHEYSSFIEGVFKNKSMEYNISDSIEFDEDEGIKTLFYIIDSLNEKFNIKEFIELIESEAFKKRFGFSNSDLDTIKSWLGNINLRWGLEEGYIKDKFESMNVFNTFEYAAKRLLYGYFSNKEKVVKGVLAYDSMSVANADILGKLVFIIEELIYFNKEIEKAKDVEKHRQIIDEIIDSFIDSSYTQSVAFMKFKEEMKKYENKNFDISFLAFYEILKSSLNKNRKEFNFLRGGITFCELVPLRSIPFKVVCLVGMNGEEFPRSVPKVSFNEMEKKPKKGDRSSRLNDRLLFLETILSARRYFYISYIGKDVKRNNQLNPSVVVSELMDFVGAKPIEHPLHSFSLKYFDKDKKNLLFNYSKEDCSLAQSLLGSRNDRKLQQIGSMEDIKSFEVKKIQLNSIVSFLKHPVKFFFIENGIDFSLYEDNLKEFENVELDALEKYIVVKKAFEENAITDSIRYSGVMPHGSFGKKQEGYILDKIDSLSKNLQKIDSSCVFGSLRKKSVDVSFDNGTTIEGQVAYVYEDMFINIEYTPKAKKKISMADVLKTVIFSALLNFKEKNINSIHFVNPEAYFTLKNPIDKNALMRIVNIFNMASKVPIVIFEPDKYNDKISFEENVKNLISGYVKKDDDSYIEYMVENFKFTEEYKDIVFDANAFLSELYKGCF